MKGSVQTDRPITGFVADDEGGLIEELRHLKSRRSSRHDRAARALHILEQTGSARVRNAAALALADLQAPTATVALIGLLRRPDTAGSRGTLLYALGELRADVPLPILAEMIVDEPYEAREEALDLVRRGFLRCSTSEFVEARTKFEAALGSADAERSDAIRRALEYLRERGPSPTA